MTRKPRATLSQRREVTRANQPVRERQRQRRAVAHDKAVRNVADPPPPPPPEAQVAMYHFQGNQNNTERRDRQRAPRRGGFEFRFQRPKISERPLLTTKHEASEELTFRSDNVQDKFREVENLSETDDEQMEFSDSEDEAQPSKRIRLEANDSSANAGPRWSNPDPYTSLPPVDDSNRKHKDVVKLIRKARIDGIVGQGAPAATNQDFISFDFDYNEYNDASIAPRPTVGLQSSAPPNAPVGPKADVAMTDGSEVPANAPIRPKADDVTRSGQGTDVYAPTGPKANVTRITGQQMPKQPPAQDNISLGKRKRDDNPRPPRKRKTNSDGMVLVEWQAGANVDSTPWLTGGDDKELEPPGVSLHKEIIDFYEWIRPRDFEHAVRADLVYRLQKAFERIEPGGQLKPFGSFAAGLYLPTGDMDLVYLRRNFSGKSISQNGKIIKPHIGTLSSFATFIANKNIAVPGTVKRIFHAKVPIIKFVESVSGLKVDLSFDNDTGVTANQTFHKWKAQYPAMPILVSIIKHFLMIRGLNDVAFGGLGGFSIICLVTSLVQHFPITSQPPNLGLMLLEFFNLYGNLFNRDEIAIRLDPPGYVQKASNAYLVVNKEKPGCLSIIDPHRPDNNISAGTFEVQSIISCFRNAHKVLSRRLDEELDGPNGLGSLLEDILGGNFSAYEIQREALYQVHKTMLVPPAPAFAAPRIPPPPPPTPATNVLRDATQSSSQDQAPIARSATQGSAPTNHEASSSTTQSTGTAQDSLIPAGLRKNMNRALRFQELRPDVTKVKTWRSLSVVDAVKFGGYKDSDEMTADLMERAKAVGKDFGAIKV